MRRKLININPYYKPKKFKCPHCVRDFNKPRQLKNHIKDAHPEIKKESINAIGK